MTYIQNKWESKWKYTIHKWANGLVIMAVKKDEFRAWSRNLVDIDSWIGDMVMEWYLTQLWLPFNCILWYTHQNTIHKNPAWDWNIRWN